MPHYTVRKIYERYSWPKVSQSTSVLCLSYIIHWRSYLCVCKLTASRRGYGVTTHLIWRDAIAPPSRNCEFSMPTSNYFLGNFRFCIWCKPTPKAQTITSCVENSRIMAFLYLYSAANRRRAGDCQIASLLIHTYALSNPEYHSLVEEFVVSCHYHSNIVQVSLVTIVYKEKRIDAAHCSMHKPCHA